MRFVAESPQVTVNGVNLSSWVARVYWEEFVEIVDQTGPGDAARKRRGSVRDGEIVVEWVQDYGPGAVFRTLHPLLGRTVPVEIKPQSGPTRTVNPRHTCNVVIDRVPVLDAQIGELSTVETAWPFSGLPTYSEAHFETTMTVGRSGDVYGYRSDNHPHNMGSIAEDEMTMPDGTIITITGIEYNRAHDWLAIYFPNHSQASLMRYWTLEAGSLESYLWYSLQATDTFYREQRIGDPGWSVGDQVPVSLWLP